MAETMKVLESLAYLAGGADSIQDRRILDEMLRLTDTAIDEDSLLIEVVQVNAYLRELDLIPINQSRDTILVQNSLSASALISAHNITDVRKSEPRVPNGQLPYVSAPVIKKGDKVIALVELEVTVIDPGSLTREQNLLDLVGPKGETEESKVIVSHELLGEMKVLAYFVKQK